MIQSSAQNHIFYNDVHGAQKWGVRNYILRIYVCAHPT